MCPLLIPENKVMGKEVCVCVVGTYLLKYHNYYYFYYQHLRLGSFIESYSVMHSKFFVSLPYSNNQFMRSVLLSSFYK